MYMQVQRLSLYKQIELFQGIQELIREKIGRKEAERFFEESRYVVALGSNDFINNYLMPVYTASWKYNDQTFIPYLMDTLRSQLIVRKFLLFYFNNIIFMMWFDFTSSILFV